MDDHLPATFCNTDLHMGSALLAAAGRGSVPSFQPIIAAIKYPQFNRMAAKSARDAFMVRNAHMGLDGTRVLNSRAAAETKKHSGRWQAEWRL